MYPLLIIVIYHCHVSFHEGKFGVSRQAYTDDLLQCQSWYLITNDIHSLKLTASLLQNKHHLTLKQAHLQALSFRCYVTFKEVPYFTSLQLRSKKSCRAQHFFQHWVSQQLQPEVTQWKRSRPKISFTMALHRTIYSRYPKYPIFERRYIFQSIISWYLHSRKLTWNLKMMVSNRNLLFQVSIFGCHVSFRGCIWKFSRVFWWCVCPFFIFSKIFRHSKELTMDHAEPQNRWMTGISELLLSVPGSINSLYWGWETSHF